MGSVSKIAHVLCSKNGADGRIIVLSMCLHILLAAIQRPMCHMLFFILARNSCSVADLLAFRLSQDALEA